MKKAKKLQREEENKNSRDAIVYQATVFILDKLRTLMLSKNGESFARVKPMDSVFYSIYGEKKFATRLCYANTDREIAMILDEFGAGRLLHMMNTPIVYCAIDDLLEIDKELKKLEKQKKKCENKSLIFPKKKEIRYKKLADKYTSGIKKIRKLYDIHKSIDSTGYSGLNDFIKSNKKKNKFDNSDFVKKYQKSMGDVNSYKNFSFSDNKGNDKLVNLFHGRDEQQMGNVYVYPNNTNLPFNTIPYDSAFGQQLQMNGMNAYINGNGNYYRNQNQSSFNNGYYDNDEDEYEDDDDDTREIIENIQKKRSGKAKSKEENKYCTVDDIKDIISDVMEKMSNKDQKKETEVTSMQDMYLKLREDMNDMVKNTLSSNRNSMSNDDLYANLRRDMQDTFYRGMNRDRGGMPDPFAYDTQSINRGPQLQQSDDKYDFVLNQMSQLQQTVANLANVVATAKSKEEEDDDEESEKKKIKKKNKKKDKKKKKKNDTEYLGFDIRNPLTLTLDDDDEDEDDEDEDDEDDDDEDIDSEALEYLYLNGVDQLIKKLQEEPTMPKEKLREYGESLCKYLYGSLIYDNEYAPETLTELAENIREHMSELCAELCNGVPSAIIAQHVNKIKALMKECYSLIGEYCDELNGKVKKSSKDKSSKKYKEKKKKKEEEVDPHEDEYLTQDELLALIHGEELPPRNTQSSEYEIGGNSNGQLLGSVPLARPKPQSSVNAYNNTHGN